MNWLRLLDILAMTRERRVNASSSKESPMPDPEQVAAIAAALDAHAIHEWGPCNGDDCASDLFARGLRIPGTDDLAEKVRALPEFRARPFSEGGGYGQFPGPSKFGLVDRADVLRLITGVSDA